MFQAYLLDDPRYRQCDDLKDLAAAIEAYVAELGRASVHRKLVRVLVTVGDLEGTPRPEAGACPDPRPTPAGPGRTRSIGLAAASSGCSDARRARPPPGRRRPPGCRRGARSGRFARGRARSCSSRRDRGSARRARQRRDADQGVVERQSGTSGQSRHQRRRSMATTAGAIMATSPAPNKVAPTADRSATMGVLADRQEPS